ncbi:hypothetical protein [Streptomyces sp. NPDC059371]|uniref:hypothetical protein n=1 Tax=Streptomyces sp. NPDC059371 TaxID=3346812 RepID=UPI0036B43991
MTPEHAAAEARLQAALATALDDGWRVPDEPQKHLTAFLTHDSGSWAMFLPVPPIGLIALIAGREDGRPRQAEPYTPDLDKNTDLYEWLASGELTGPAQAMAASIRNVLKP